MRDVAYLRGTTEDPPPGSIKHSPGLGCNPPKTGRKTAYYLSNPTRLVGGGLLGPKLMADLRELNVLEIWNVVQAPVDRLDFIRREFQHDLFLPELIQRKIVAGLR